MEYLNDFFTDLSGLLWGPSDYAFRNAICGLPSNYPSAATRMPLAT